MRKVSMGHEGRLMTVAEVAEALHCSRNSVYRLSERGRIPRVKVGAAVRFELGEVVAALREPQSST